VKKENDRNRPREQQEGVWEPPNHRLSHATRLPQRPQDEFIKRCLGGRPQVICLTAGAHRLDLLKITLQLLLKPAHEIRIQENLSFPSTLDIEERDIAGRPRLDFLFVDKMNH
jgi:hypothetical protein